MPFARIAIVAVLAASLGGCFLTSPRDTTPELGLPPLPIDIAAACRDPGVKAGQPVVSEFAKNRAALASCRRGGLGNAAFYNDLPGD